jgi:hypothetical protein
MIYDFPCTSIFVSTFPVCCIFKRARRNMTGSVTASMTDLTSCLIIYSLTRCQASLFTGWITGISAMFEQINDFLVTCMTDWVTDKRTDQQISLCKVSHDDVWRIILNNKFLTVMGNKKSQTFAKNSSALKDSQMNLDFILESGFSHFCSHALLQLHNLSFDMRAFKNNLA